jgi:hypothetical protein
MAWQEPLTKFERRMTWFLITLTLEAFGMLYFLWLILEKLTYGYAKIS